MLPADKPSFSSMFVLPLLAANPWNSRGVGVIRRNPSSGVLTSMRDFCQLQNFPPDTSYYRQIPADRTALWGTRQKVRADLPSSSFSTSSFPPFTLVPSPSSSSCPSNRSSPHLCLPLPHPLSLPFPNTPVQPAAPTPHRHFHPPPPFHIVPFHPSPSTYLMFNSFLFFPKIAFSLKLPPVLDLICHSFSFRSPSPPSLLFLPLWCLDDS